MNWSELIGKKVVAFRGRKTTRFGGDVVELSAVLFDDGETYLALSPQDPYDYHDCSPCARELDLRKDRKIWAAMYDGEDGYLESSADTPDPFW